ncbi:MAG: c-type cytochrome biogenesis protein CcmI, partial [Paracoccaceae bacterium]
MTFWLIAAAAALLTAALLVLALLRGGRSQVPPAAYDLQVYRDQLKEVEKDLARGVVSREDAERVRVEVSRRILEADRALAKG